MGVNTHFNWTSSPYVTRFADVKAALDELGIHHIRDVIGDPSALARLRDLNTSLGIKLTGMVDERTGTGRNGVLVPGRIAAKIDDARQLLGARVLAAVEGPNEYNLLERDHNYLGWVSELREFQRQLYARVKADSTLRALPVLAPSLGGPNDDQYFVRLGDLSGTIDIGNAHTYPNWLSLEQKLGESLASVRRASPRQPIHITETGWHQAFNSGAMWVSDAAILKYLPRAMATIAADPDVRRAFFYQLLEAYPDPNRLRTGYNYALIDHSLRRRVSFYAVRNTMHVMCDNALSFAPQSLRYSLSGNLANIRSDLYQKANRSFYLVIRLEKQSFQAGRDIYNPPQAVTLRFEQPIAQVRLYQPADQTGGLTNSNLPKHTFSNPTSLALSVPDSLMILEITPSGVGAASPSTRCNFTPA